jgi:hypothetical protein
MNLTPGDGETRLTAAGKAAARAPPAILVAVPA